MGSGVQKQREVILVANPAEPLAEKAALLQIAKAANTVERPSYSLRSNPELEVRRVQLNAFDVIRTIGGNSWSRVKLVRELSSGEILALKIYWKGNIVRAGEVRHCFNEKKALELVRSQWWQSLLGLGQDEHCLYFALEFVQGGEFFRLLRSHGKLTLRETEFYSSEVLLALSEIHSWCFIYRDLKPENILLDASGHVKLCDMHLAKFMKKGTRTYTLCGTPEYMSPEMVEGSGHSFESDWWQLGVLVYELLSGKSPFYDPSPFVLYTKILQEEVRFPGYFAHTTCLLLSELLVKQPKSRLKESEIKYHPFFKATDWTKAARQMLSPPFISRRSDNRDEFYYDRYQETLPNADFPIKEFEDVFKTF